MFQIAEVVFLFFLSVCSTGSSARRARRVEGNAVCDLVNASLSLLSLLVVFVDFAVGFWFSFLAFFWSLWMHFLAALGA